MKKFIIISSDRIPMEWNSNESQLMSIGFDNKSNRTNTKTIKTYSIDEVSQHIENSKNFRISQNLSILNYYILEVIENDSKNFIILSDSRVLMEFFESYGQLYCIGASGVEPTNIKTVKSYTIDEVNIHIENSKIFRFRKDWPILPYYILEVL